MAMVFLGLVATAGAASAAPAHEGRGYNCKGGNVPAGNYDSMTITGVCYMPAGTVNIRENLTVAPGALLDATTPGDPAGGPLLPATVRVGGNVSVGAGAVLFLGCSPNIVCPEPPPTVSGGPAITYDSIGGNLNAFGALGVVVHSTAIGDNVSLLGGGGGVAGGPNSGACFDTVHFPVPAPWSSVSDPNLASGPVYSDIEDVSIAGNLRVIGLQSCWLGTLRDHVGGDVTFIGNTFSDPDAMEVNRNVIGGDMRCFSNLPAVQFGEGGTPNMVGERGSGECAFNVIDPNPAPEAGGGPSVNEPIAVSNSSLGHFAGTHTQTMTVASVVLGTTSSGDTIVQAKYAVVLGGTGLTGTVKEGALITVHPKGSDSFTAVDTCTCSFGGQSGTVVIRAYGTTSAHGLISGTFIVISADGGLATLAGHGTFSSAGQPAGTVSLVERLRIT